uniref:receptor protein-tyrosine kinase n=1 Tax=Acrobeloides nanus TaxID=290746 RepID=A0A914DBF3_9BILA
MLALQAGNYPTSKCHEVCRNLLKLCYILTIFLPFTSTDRNFPPVLNKIAERNGTIVLEGNNSVLSLTNSEDLSSLLEFKFVNETSIFYCTPRNCRLCDVPSQHCTSYIIESSKENLYQIRAEVVNDQVLLRAVRNGGNASIFAYDRKTSKDSNVRAIKIAHDNDNIKDHKVVGSFHTDAYSFFIGSAKRNDLPFAVFSTKNKRRRTDVRLTRICNQDQTPSLESTIDIVLSCNGIGSDMPSGSTDYLDDPNIAINNVATAMTFTNKTLYVAIQKKSGKQVSNVICGYDLPTLYRAFDETWNKCQDTNNASAIAKECEEADNYDKMKDECFVYSWERAKTKRIPLCERFSKSILNYKLKNCELGTSTSTADRHGWLENFKPVEGELIAKLDNDKTFISIQESQIDPNTFFLLSSEGDLTRVTKDFKKASEVLWKDVANKMPYLIYHSSTGNLFYATFSEIKSMHVSCQGFYSNCEPTEWDDPLNCVWCAHPNGLGHSISLFHKNVCDNGEQLLKQECPPAIKKVESTDKNIYISGVNLKRLKNLSAEICGAPCDLKSQEDSLIRCHVDGRKNDACDITLHGDLQSYTNFTLRYRQFDTVVDGSDDSNTTSPPNDSSNHSKEIRYVISVVAVVALIALVILLLFLYKKFYLKIFYKHRHMREKSSTSQQPTDIVLDVINNGHYIDPTHLIKLRKLGEGFSAVVYLMSYRPTSRSEIQVAVKNIHNINFDIDDALREMELISNCEHPNIVSFIGYFKDANFDSLHLVTEYMPGGNLHTYLREPANKPTIGDCFSYILQISDGMEYLGHNHLVHRDLAARNCLLDITNKIVKITDFGLSRRCNIDDYDYVSQNTSGKQVNLPIRWTAIEVLRDPTRFSDKSDVWSYGVVLWEIFMRGELPYVNMNQEEIKTYLFEGRRLEQPQYSPEDLYKVMCRCWEELPTVRPKFSLLKIQINEVLEHLQNQNPAYLTVEYERPNSKSVDSMDATTSRPIVHANSETQLVNQTAV